MKKGILILGSGSREAAFARQFALFSDYMVFVAPGNVWIKLLSNSDPNPNVELVPIKPTPENFQKLTDFALENNVEIILVGPEDPLCAGFKNFVEKQTRDIKIIGPTKEAAQLEGSKWFAKQFMLRNKIPTARARLFSKQSDYDGIGWIKDHQLPVVLKANGLCAGKGVSICNTAEKAISEFKRMINGKFDKASAEVLVEDFMDGVEVSVFVLIDDNGNYIILPEAKDYKRLLNGDEGPNTGGMGAVSPVPFFTELLRQEVEETIIKPTIKGMAKEDNPYTGFLYIGLMIVEGKPFVVEYNCRMGDPETAVVLDRIETQFVPLIEAASSNTLDTFRLEPAGYTSLGVVLASEGYPENPIVDRIIQVPDLSYSIDKGNVFGAGVREENGQYFTSGGRVCLCLQRKNNFQTATRYVYGIAGDIPFEGKQYRTDIGKDIYD